MRRPAPERRRRRAVPPRNRGRRHAAPYGRRACDPHVRAGTAGQGRQTGVAGRHHAPHPRRGRGVPLHPPRPQRQPGADPLAAQSQKTRRTHRARNTDLPLRRRIRAITLRAQAETAHRPHLPPPDGPSPTTPKSSAGRQSASPTASTSGASRSRRSGTAAPTKSGCWPWRTFTSGTVWTA